MNGVFLEKPFGTLILDGWEQFQGNMGEAVRCQGMGCKRRTGAGFYHAAEDRWLCDHCFEIDHAELFDQFLAGGRWLDRRLG